MDSTRSLSESSSARQRRMSAQRKSAPRCARGLLMMLALPCLAWGAESMVQSTPADAAADAPAATLQQRAEGQMTSSLAARSRSTVTTFTAEQQRVAAPALHEGASADAQGRPFTQSAELMLHRWARAGRAAIGVGVGATGMMPADSAQWSNVAPLLTVGARLHMAGEATLYADAAKVGPKSVASYYGQDSVRTRIGLEFKGVNTARNLGLERGSIGMQLQSGYRLQLRPRKGGVAVYLRGQF